MKKEQIAKIARLFSVFDQESGKQKPIELSEKQQELFATIVGRTHKRVHVMTITRYGKSFVVALAVLVRAVLFGEKWAIVAPSHPKVMIIMRYIIDFAYSNPEFRSQLDMEEKQKDRLKREVSKTRLTFRRGGEIFVLSADSRNKAAAGEALMGFGCPNIILDESSLIDDDIYSKIFRMLGDNKDNFMLEIGNPFHRNHFFKNYHNDDYKKIVVDWKVALKEGRATKEFIEEMRKKAFFDILYECKFPKEEDVDYDGWSLLVGEHDITESYRDDDPNAYGSPRLGVDIARSGGNFNVWILRTGNYARILGKTTTDNLMDVVGTTRKYIEEYNVAESDVFLDATGLGAGVYDRFRELGFSVSGINMAESAVDKEKYINIRAEAYFRLREWMKAGGMLQRDSEFMDLNVIKYKMRSNGKLQIIDKETLRKNGIPSPDVADALMLTFGRDEEGRAFVNKNKVRENRAKQPKYD